MHKDKGDIFWIGDVHGCAKTLQALLNRIPEGKAIGFLGDITDRGVDSIGCIRLALEYGTYFVEGNHDRMMFNALLVCGDHAEDLWMRCGGTSTYIEMIETGDMNAMRSLVKAYKDKCSVYYECDEYIAAHASIPIDFDGIRAISKDDEESFLWGCIENACRYAETYDKQVVLGHHWNRACNINVDQACIVIDTSCVQDGELTAFNPITKQIIHQQNIEPDCLCDS